MSESHDFVEFNHDQRLPGEPEQVDKLLAVLCHVSVLFSLSMITLALPIGCLFVSSSPYVRENARQSLNFQINILLWAIAGFFLSFLGVGVIILIFLAVGQFILPIMGAFNAAEGNIFNYPLCHQFLKRK